MVALGHSCCCTYIRVVMGQAAVRIGCELFVAVVLEAVFWIWRVFPAALAGICAAVFPFLLCLVFSVGVAFLVLFRPKGVALGCPGGCFCLQAGVFSVCRSTVACWLIPGCFTGVRWTDVAPKCDAGGCRLSPSSVFVVLGTSRHLTVFCISPCLSLSLSLSLSRS